MLLLKLTFASLAIFRIAASEGAEEKIEPIDMAYNCINPVTDEENPAKSPVILIHGMGVSQKIWKGINRLYADQTKRTVCAVDLRNHGDSPWNNSTDIRAVAVDIDHFLDKHGIKKVNIVGQSLGGLAASYYALNNPDRVDSIVVEDARPNSIPEEAILRVSLMFHILKTALKSIPEGMDETGAQKIIIDFLNRKLEQIGSTVRLPDHYADFVDIKFTDGKWRFKHNSDLLLAVVKDSENYFKKISGLYEGPALFIYGTKSLFKVGEDKENILKLFPNAQFYPVEGASHDLHPFDEYKDAVLTFLNKVN